MPAATSLTIARTPAAVYDYNKLVAWTVEAWVCPTTVSASPGQCFFGLQFSNNYNQTTFFNIYLNTAGVYMTMQTNSNVSVFGNTTATQSGCVSSPPVAGTWMHIAAQYDGRSCFPIRKRRPAAALLQPPPSGYDGFGSFQLGCDGASANYFNGALDSIKISRVQQYLDAFTPGPLSSDAYTLYFSSFQRSDLLGTGWSALTATVPSNAAVALSGYAALVTAPILQSNQHLVGPSKDAEHVWRRRIHRGRRLPLHRHRPEQRARVRLRKQGSVVTISLCSAVDHERAHLRHRERLHAHPPTRRLQTRSSRTCGGCTRFATRRPLAL